MPRPTPIALAALAGAALAALAAIPLPAAATERLWTGAAVDDLWSTVELGGRSNWSTGFTLGQPTPQDGDRLAFHQGAARTAATTSTACASAASTSAPAPGPTR